MRANDIPQHLWRAVRDHLPEDVAEAIVADEDAHGVVIHHAGNAADTPEELHAVIGGIAGRVDDRCADWLVDGAESPAAWLAAQIRDW